MQVCREEEPDETWWEDYDEDIEDPEKWGREKVEWFNSTLKTGEKKRKYLGYEIIK